MKLTKTVIDKLPTPTDGYALYRDDELPGFGVRVTHAGVKSFFLEKRIHRKVKRLTLGRYGVLTAEQARREAVKLLGRIATGGDPLADRAQTRLESVTLGEAFDAYLKARGSLKPITIKDMHNAMKGFQDWLKKPLLSITRDMIARRHRALGEASQARANLAMRYLRAIFNFAMAEYTDAQGKPLLTDNPVKKLSQTRAWFRVDRRQTVIKPHQLGPWMQAVLRLDKPWRVTTCCWCCLRG